MLLKKLKWYTFFYKKLSYVLNSFGLKPFWLFLVVSIVQRKYKNGKRKHVGNMKHYKTVRMQKKNEPPQNFPVSRMYQMFPRFFTNSKVFRVRKCKRCGSLNPRRPFRLLMFPSTLRRNGDKRKIWIQKLKRQTAKKQTL